jgi:uncharacterized protein YecE (DUF72 family)
MQVYTGTSGFSYKEWKGAFYPEDLPSADMLSYYAGRLPAVEINNTFYRLPKPDVLESWFECVPASFRFVLKASRRITHFKRLKDVEQVAGYMFETTAPLHEKLGAILFQLPPNFSKDVERLEAFLPVVPAGIRAAFEFRHDSWRDPRVYAVLERHDAAWCIADTERLPEDIISTADWGYLRLRRPDYSVQDLAAWAKRIWATSWKEVYVFFKHEDAGAGPRMAARFQALVDGGET